jgi:CelD/BcsL family acetyltransferase involved in cellulose biosynthesis
VVSVELTKPQELGPSEIHRWEEIRSGSATYASPFFTHEFAAAVGAAREDLRLAVIEDGSTLAGFFAFHQQRGGHGQPVGTKLNDYQGFVVAPSLQWDAAALIGRAGLRSFAFDHLIASQGPFRPYFRSVEPSPLIDLSGGYEAYLASQGSHGHGGAREAAMKRRRLERRFAVQFEIEERSGQALKTLFRLKSQQYRRTGIFDAFSLPWVVEVVERLHETRTDALTGVLSTLRTDDTLIAVHLGLRSGNVLHSWFPAYDPSWAKYSPGAILLLAIAERLCCDGASTLDLGKGAELYKTRFANGAIELGIGSVEVGLAAALRAAAVRRAWGTVLRSPLSRRANRVRRRREFGR